MTKPPVLQFHIVLPPQEAEAVVRAALQEHGFGILTEVDVAATLRARLGVETKPHKLLGACNPPLSHAVLEVEPAVGAFLPCGVAIREGATADETIVAVQDPAIIASSFGSSALEAPSTEVRDLLRTALETVGTPMP